ncbi:MAG: M15 family metallopeptidase [Pseudomonadota bacterium]
MNNTPSARFRLITLFAELGIPLDYGKEPYRPAHDEAKELADAGENFLGRSIKLEPTALTAWESLSEVAMRDGVTLLLVSGYRSYEYQAELIRRKRASGQEIDEILRTVAAPGFSEHHTGRAIDVASPGTRPLTEEFASSPAWAWLQENAKSHDFTMTYPKGNEYGFIYEPWHWCFAGS